MPKSRLRKSRKKRRPQPRLAELLRGIATQQMNNGVTAVNYKFQKDRQGKINGGTGEAD